MKTRLGWRCGLASLLLVLGMSVSGQAGQNDDLSPEAMDTMQAQTAPAYTAQAASCPTANYKVDDALGHAFEDISGSAAATNLGLGDDEHVTIPIGFTFNYYCTSYTSVTVNSNGTLTFDLGAPNISLVNQPLPYATSDYSTIVAVYWDDLDPGEPGAAVLYEVKGTAPNRRLIVQWQNVPRYGVIGAGTFEVVLFESTNKILFKYQDVNFGDATYDYGAAATVGIQKDGTTAVQYSYNTASLADGDAILFAPQAEPCPTAGYYYDDMVPYNFEDISGTGTGLGLALDHYAAVPLPFPFSFYCAEYSTIFVNDSGVINFADQNQTYANSCLPATIGTLPTFVAPFWDDLLSSSPGEVYYQVKGTSPNRRVIIQWDGVKLLGGSGDLTFQAILYETTNKILFQYQDVSTSDGSHLGAAATVGIQGDSTSYLEYSCNSASLANGLAILFTPYGEITTPSPSSTGLDYDCHRNGVWNASQNDGNLYMYDAESGVLVRTIVMAGKVLASDGSTNDVAVLDNGNLLLSDYNGDVATIDDYLFEFDPDKQTMVSYWPLDGAWNTSTDGTNIDQVRGVEMVDNRFWKAYVTSALNNNVYEIQLTPGKPGTWKTIAVHGPLSAQISTSGIDKVACYEDTPITGYAVGDRNSTVVNFYTKTFTLNSNFGAQHGASFNNYGVTVVPGNPAKLWVSDTGASGIDIDTIGIFDTQQKCSMHCGKFPWPMFLPGIEQGTTP